MRGRCVARLAQKADSLLEDSSINGEAACLVEHIHDGCGLTLWTTYTPPRKIGPVRDRFLEVSDYSAPNSMGIYYRLFRHPALALPVIYHEFLHYGGPDGVPREGISNETEVLLRELIFARGLLARLAPANEEEIPRFEKGIVEAALETSFGSLLFQLAADLRDDGVLASLNAGVLGPYGGGRTREEAERETDGDIERENAMIQFENRVSTWHPEIAWPPLGAIETESVTQAFRQIRVDQRIRRHGVTSEERDQIMACAPSRSWLHAWQGYCQRRNAQVEFLRACAVLSLPPKKVIELIARRFLDRSSRAF